MSSEGDFEFEVEVDDNGLVLVRCRGRFDVDAWLEQSEAVRARDYPDVDLTGRPVLCDIRECSLPAREWMGEFRRIYAAIEEQRPEPFRIAFVINRNHGKYLAMKLFIDLGRVLQIQSFEPRLFHDFDTAYAWAREGWPER